MKKYVYLFVSVFAIAAAVWLSGCGDDECVVCPPEPQHVPDYHLLFSYVSYGFDNYVMVYSTKTGKAIDSLHYRGNPFDNMLFSHDGLYACYTSNYNLRIGGSETLVTAWPSHDTVAHLLGTGGLAACLTPDDRYLFLTGGRLVAILTFPDLQIVFRDSTDRRWGDGSSGSATSWAGALHPTKRLAYVTIEPYYDSIFVLDYSESPVTISSFQLKDRQGTVRHSRGPQLCTEERLVFVHSGYLGVHDPLTLAPKISRVITPHRLHGGMVRPQTSKFFLIWNEGMHFPVGGIDKYDLDLDIFETYVERGDIDMGGEPFVPSDLDFTPDGRDLYVMMGADGLWLGPILEIEVNSKEVTKRWNFTNGFSHLIRLNPRNFATQ